MLEQLSRNLSLIADKTPARERWLRLQMMLIRYSEQGAKESPLRELEAPLLAAIACQGQNSYPYLNQRQLSTLLKKPQKNVLSAAKRELVNKGFCEELSLGERRKLHIAPNERNKYYKTTRLGLQALAEHDEITAALPSAIMDCVRATEGYASVMSELEQRLQQYLRGRFEAASGGQARSSPAGPSRHAGTLQQRSTD